MEGSRKRSMQIKIEPGEVPSKKQRYEANLVIKRQRESLPIFAQKAAFLDTVFKNQVTIVVGATGSGKSTQIPQYLSTRGYGDFGCIACTQPRRVAASSIAVRVSKEFGCDVGQEVGYKIRFEDCTSAQTAIKYMTDGMLIQECLRDRWFNAYSVVMLDEVHERTISTDVLLGLLKMAIKQREDLKVIVASATMDAEKFSHYFNNAPIFTIPGRTFPVDIFYTNLSDRRQVLKAAEEKVIDIHLHEPMGDILVFLPGHDEIEALCTDVANRITQMGSTIQKLVILPLYGILPLEEQMKVFQPVCPGARKAVFATNIAESALTIDGIVYVIDSGVAKQRIHRPKNAMDVLDIVDISQAEAIQRAGRAGRTCPGKCYRLYSEEQYRDRMPHLFIPEIKRSDLAPMLLKMKAMGLKDLVSFDFLDTPSSEALAAAIFHLHVTGALEDDDESLTELGRKMAKFPLEPSLAKYLVLSVEMGCSDEVLTIIAMLSVQHSHKLFRNSRQWKKTADRKHAGFHRQEGDHLTLLDLYNAWKQHRCSLDWCKKNYLTADALWKAQEIRNQLLRTMDYEDLAVVNCGSKTERIQQAICATFFYNAAVRRGTQYSVLRGGETACIRQDCSLFTDRPEWVVCNELLKTSKGYMQQVTKIEADWLTKLAPSFFYSNCDNSLPVFNYTKYDELWKRVSESATVSMFEKLSVW